MTVGEKIKYYRNIRGISQEMLGNLSGINPATIKKYEYGIRNPKPDQLLKITNALGISINLFMDFDIETVSDVLSLLFKLDEQVDMRFEAEKDENGEFIRDPQKDLVKIAVVERHQGTGNVACGFLKGYGIKAGAVALSVAHDSHNIIAVGVSDEEITFAVESLIKQEGGIVLVKEGKIIEEMPMPIAGLMSDRSGEWVDQKLTEIHEKAYTELGICGEVEPVMTLCFMSLAVIPELKLTDMGLFDVTTFQFISVEAE